VLNARFCCPDGADEQLMVEVGVQESEYESLGPGLMPWHNYTPGKYTVVWTKPSTRLSVKCGVERSKLGQGAGYLLVLGWVPKYMTISLWLAVTHQTCLVLWTWRKLADETNAKNAPKISWKIVLTWGIQTALAIHITQSQDYPYAKNEYKLIIVIYHTRTIKKQKESNE